LLGRSPSRCPARQARNASYYVLVMLLTLGILAWTIRSLLATASPFCSSNGSFYRPARLVRTRTPPWPCCEHPQLPST
jgi:hypothetical protein